MTSIDDLIRKIDDELLVLGGVSEIGGTYKWFDFKTALRLLNDKIQNEGFNDYRKRKASEYINVFNDLCQIVESIEIRTLSYDKKTGIKVIEEHRSNSLEHRSEFNKSESQVAPELRKYIETLDLPEQVFTRLTDTAKIEYLLRNCNVDYTASPHFSKPGADDPELDSILGEIGMGSVRLCKKDSFDRYFDVDINFWNKHRISFEGYIKQVKAERNVEDPSTNDKITIPRFNINLTDNQRRNLRQSLITYGYVSDDTDEASFSWVFGANLCPQNFCKIQWIKPVSTAPTNTSKRALFNLLYSLGVTNRGDLSDNRRYKALFITNNKPLSMSSNNISQAEGAGWSSEYKDEINKIISEV